LTTFWNSWTWHAADSWNKHQVFTTTGFIFAPDGCVVAPGFALVGGGRPRHSHCCGCDVSSHDAHQHHDLAATRTSQYTKVNTTFLFDHMA